MTKREGELKSRLYQEIKHQLPGFYVLQYATNGAPDREIVGAGVTTRWEAKHATPDFDSPADQELMCCRLAAAGVHCRYIIWYEHKNIQRTMIVRPSVVRLRSSWNLIPETFCVGFDMRWLVDQIKKAHGL